MRYYRKREWRKTRQQPVKGGVWVRKCKIREPKEAPSRVWSGDLYTFSGPRRGSSMLGRGALPDEVEVDATGVRVIL